MIIETETNWAGTITFSRPVHHPTSTDELSDLVARARRVRVVGSGHSFNEIADGDDLLVSLDGLDEPIVVDAQARTVTVGGGMRYAQLSSALDHAGLALPNLGSLPHLSVAGACATATHGSGDGNGNLATAVSGLDVMTSDGSMVSLRRDRDGERFAGAVVALGMLGVVVRVALDLVPTFSVRQWVYEDLSWTSLIDDVDAIFASGYSVSVFTRWRPESAGMLWIKRRSDDPRPDEPVMFGAQAADGPRHPIAGLPTQNCTAQLGDSGPWHDRLPHFRAEFTPSAGDEIQSEYLIPRDHARAAIETLRGLGERISPVLQVGELRTVAADDLWLSPSYRRDVLGVHLTWVKDAGAVLPAVRVVEEALAPFDARPHWGKVFTTAPEVIRSRYPRMSDFAALARELDPQGTFRNAFVDRFVP